MDTSLAPFRLVAAALLAQRGRLFLWVPVMLAAGIGIYFQLRWEPGPAHFAGAAGAAAVLALIAWRWPGAWAPLPGAAALVLAGICLAGARAHMVAAPVLDFRYYGPVEGRVVALDRSVSDAPRVTLDRVVLSRVETAELPGRVRVALHGAAAEDPPGPGLRVMVTAHLSPPAGPVEPGGFDFQRNAWFAGLGAVGYARTPMLAIAPAAGGPAQAVLALRMRLAAALRAEMPGQAGAIAAAILVGDRSGVSRAVLEDLRASNLAHLLAISGLHMGLLTGLVFGAVRAGVALVPRLALRVSGKKLAAAAALPAGLAYLVLSGASVATERAFVMAAVVLGAVLLDRRALTLRAVAVAAVIVLCLRPESLVGPGFQMSFAATTALVMVFGAIRDATQARRRAGRPARLPRWARWPVGVLISSAVAGAATAPVGAFHFNQMSHYGLIANLASVPVMGALVMPAAVAGLLLWPLGLAGPAFAAMAAGIDWILGVAHHVAGFEGAVRQVVTPPGAVLPLLAGGALVLTLWRGSARMTGGAAILAAAALWIGAERPLVLVSDDGRLVGVMGTQGRALNRERGAGFVALSWLENDGDPALQAVAAARTRPELPGIGFVTGRAEAGAVDAACRAHALVIAPEADAGAASCQVIDRETLRRLGAVAIRPGPDGPRITGARQVTGARLWTR